MIQKYTYPFIAKPDRGSKGYGLKFIQNLREFREYHTKAKAPYLVQDYIEAPKEYGVFIVRLNEQVHVSSLVEKELLALEGDGKATLGELYDKHDRASNYFRKSDLPAYLDRVLLDGERVLLQPLGSHALGAKFINSNSLIDDQLRKTIAELVHSMPHFHYGRIDVKTDSIDEMKGGRYRIIDVNGAGAEPGHIYDNKYPLELAYKDLFWHWDKMAEIASKNKALGTPKTSFIRTLISMLDYYRNR